MKKKDRGSKKLEPTGFEMQTHDVLGISLTNVAEGITGLASSSRQDLTLSIGHLFQKLRGGQFLSTLLDEWNRYREKGRIKDDYQFSEQHKACLQEMLGFLDKDIPDETRFKFMKQIFLVAATETTSDRNSYLPLQFMRIGRTLTSGEILILNATYHFARDTSLWTQDNSASIWLQKIADQSGLKHPELVEVHEDELMKKNLLSKRSSGDRSGVKLGSHYRLTGLGFSFCNFVEHYNE